MPVIASAPGKAVLLGEYVVLDGAQALVMACDRRCRATIGPAPGHLCRLTTRMPEPQDIDFSAQNMSGSPLIDAVLQHFAPIFPWETWVAEVDSTAFFAGGLKLGLGSSAAALVAFAGVCRAAAGISEPPELSALIDCHRAFQRGAGSGIDVAASLTGGIAEFRLGTDGLARVGSVRLPKSVGFAGIFAGGSASTPSLVRHYRQWAEKGNTQAAALRQRMFDVAEGGCVAVREDDGAAFVAAIDAYGECLVDLGQAIGADLVTAAHRQIGDLAGRYGLAYKVSGAGGGDVGIACGLDPEAMQAFSDAASDQGFHVVPLAVDDHGLRIEEHAE
jgi:phosphomevalonate kinase